MYFTDTKMLFDAMRHCLRLFFTSVGKVPARFKACRDMNSLLEAATLSKLGNA